MIDVAPRPEDFGIRARDLEATPTPFLEQHRPEAVGLLYLVVVVGVFTMLAAASGSFAAASYLTIVGVAAASVLLLPLAFCLVCAAEQLEARWLCRTVPGVAAGRAYREALDAWRARRGAVPSPPWFALSRAALAARLAEALRRAGADLVTTPKDWDVGYDLALRVSGRTVLVRCVDGRDPAPAGIGRELAALLADGVGDEAVVAAPAGAEAALRRFVVGRPIRVVSELELDALTLVASAAGEPAPGAEVQRR